MPWRLKPTCRRRCGRSLAAPRRRCRRRHGARSRPPRAGSRAGRRTAVAGKDRIEDRAGEADAVPAQVGDGLLDAGGEGLGYVLAASTRRGAHRAHMDAQRHAGAEGGRDLGHGGGMAVIGEARHDEAGAARVIARHAQGQVHAFGAAAGEEQVGQRLGKGRQQPFGIGVDHLGQVARVRVQLRGLARHGVDDARMAVSDRGHVVVGVQVGAAFMVVQPDALGARDVDRIFIEQRHRGAEDPLAAFDQASDGRVGDGRRGGS